MFRVEWMLIHWKNETRNNFFLFRCEEPVQKIDDSENVIIVRDNHSYAMFLPPDMLSVKRFRREIDTSLRDHQFSSEDVEQIKGALFFEFRRAHHSGDYPEGNDLRYVRALGEAIDRRSRS